MTPISLVSDLRRRGVVLSTDGQGLRFKAPKGVLTAADRAALAEHKRAILDVLASEQPIQQGLDLDPAQPQQAAGSLTEPDISGDLAPDSPADPRPDLPESSTWGRLLEMAYQVDGQQHDGLYGALHGLRAWGAGLERVDGRWRRVIAGVIDPAEYPELAAQWLDPHKTALRRLLTQLGQPALSEGVEGE